MSNGQSESDPTIAARVDPELKASIDAFHADFVQKMRAYGVLPSFSDTVRRLLIAGLEAEGRSNG